MTAAAMDYLGSNAHVRTPFIDSTELLAWVASEQRRGRYAGPAFQTTAWREKLVAGQKQAAVDSMEVFGTFDGLRNSTAGKQ